LVKFGRCQQHAPDFSRGTRTERGYSNDWYKATRAWMMEDPERIWCSDPFGSHGRRLVIGTDTDHITPHRGDPRLFWDESNWQRLCKRCHGLKTKGEGDVNATPVSIPIITLVCGPPGAGKSTYVRQHMQPGDLVLDLDALLSALSGLPLHEDAPSVLPFAWEARDAVLAQLKRASTCRHAWIIDMAASLEDRTRYRHQYNADVVVLMSDRCKERTAVRQLNHVVDSWLSNYVADARDTVVST
jgi:5-methylcytosine-specific restriction protein A